MDADEGLEPKTAGLEFGFICVHPPLSALDKG
jgi:hypothetical protein